MIKNGFIFLYFLCSVQFGFSQTDNIDAENIRTIILRPTAINAYAPIVQLGEKLMLTFDDLSADEHTYSYKIVHCELDWTSSNLAESEFIDGFAQDRIRDYENSFNTLLHYTNYRVTLPNETTKLKISGNYEIAVSDENEEVVFKRRFVIYEPKVTVGVAVFKSRDISFFNTKQAVEFTINSPNLLINNPKEEIIPVILQNNNWQNAIIGLKPQFYRGSQLLYKYNKETSFWGGNEFLYFDTKSIRNTSLNIAKVELGEDLYNTYLFTDKERRNQPYTYFPDINGNFVIRILNGENNNTDADYSWVYFSLKCSANLEGKDVYVNGNFNNWQLNEENKLTFNEISGLYETKILLKQGFYNYQYITKSKEGTISTHDIDGSFYQTENDYTVLVYYKKFGSRYTKVIGVGFGNSEKINN